MIDHNKILKLAKSGKYKSHEIAEIVGCGFTTVFNVCRKHKISLNSTRKNNWKFDNNITPALSYLLGIYLADGCLEKHYGSGKISTFMIRNTEIKIINKIEKCIFSINGVPRSRTPVNKPNRKTSYAMCYYSTDFSNWVNNVCNYKDIIPGFLFNASYNNKLSFLSGIIDGDGTVSKYGYIDIRNTKYFIKEIPDFLDNMNIRHTGLRIKEILKNEKKYYAVHINRNDFNPVYLAHPIKKYRIQNPEKNMRKKKQKYKPYYFVCPDCGIKRKSRNSKRCILCHRKHPNTIKVLKKANKAANIARWGKDHLSNHNN